MEYLNELWVWLEPVVLYFFTRVAETTGLTVGTLMSIGLIFLTGLIFSLIHQITPDFIRVNYPHPSTLIGWGAFAVFFVTWRKGNIEDGVMTLLDYISKGNISEDSNFFFSISPSVFHWLYAFGVLPDKRFVRNTAKFAWGADLVMTVAGLLITWDIGLDAFSSLELWEISVVIFEGLVGGIFAEVFGIHWLLYQHKQWTKPRKTKKKEEKEK